jgi:hypothetical protein
VNGEKSIRRAPRDTLYALTTKEYLGTRMVKVMRPMATFTTTVLSKRSGAIRKNQSLCCREPQDKHSQPPSPKDR